MSASPGATVLVEKPALSDMALAITRDVQWWFSTLARIKGKDGKERNGPPPNILQKRVCGAYRRQQMAGKPCLIMILKPRQTGASTIAEAVCYHHMRRNAELNGVLMGDVDATSDKVFEIYQRYAESDMYPWDDGHERFAPNGNLTDEITLGNKSKWWKETAGSKNAGRSGTVQVIHLDEVAHYPVATGKDPTLAVLGSFHDHIPNALGFATSTPAGASGWFYNTWNDPDNGWIKIFAAWFEFEDHTKAFDGPEERAQFADSLTDDERDEQKIYAVTLEQLHWRRHTIKTKCEGDVNKFRQEFPSDPQTCFLLSSSPRFNMAALKSMRVHTTNEDKNGRRGVLVPQGAQNSKQVSFRQDPGSGSGGVRLWEEPRLGCRYVLGVDTCRGKDQQVSGTTAERDWHSAQVWRAAYLNPGTDYFSRAKLVAHHRSQIEADVLADVVMAMSFYFGNCLTVIELNDGAGFYLVKELHKRRVNLYRREPFRLQKPGMRTEDEKLEAFGWNTDKATKRWLIETVVPLVRDEQIDLSDLVVQQEFETFIVNKHGQSEAMPGKKDDCVMGAALALYNIGSATEFRPQFVSSIDLMRLARDPRYMAPNGWKRE